MGLSPAPDGSTSGSRAPSGSEASSNPIAGPSGNAGSGNGNGAPGGITWNRVNLGFVSAYVLVRDGEGAIVDTGVSGSVPAIAAVLRAVQLEWTDVTNVILTHKHLDHAGSIDAVLAAATAATAWIGAADLSAVASAHPLGALHDGDEVFGLQVIATPGHTAGHISLLDPVAGILLAGDALRTDGGPLAGSNPQFTADAEAAKASVGKLGGLTFETLLPGHGEPILRGASRQVRALAGG